MTRTEVGERTEAEVQRTRDGWRLLASVLKEHRRGLSTAVLIGVVWGLVKITSPLIVRQAVDTSIRTRQHPLLLWVLVLVALGMVAAVLTATRRWYAFREARVLETVLRERIFTHLQRLHIGFFDRSQTGQLMSRAHTDLLQVHGFVVMIPLTISNIAMVFGVTAILLVLDPLLALVALAPLPFVNVLANRFSRRIHPAVLETQQESAELATVVEESVSGIRVVKGFGAESVQSERLHVEADDVRRASLRSNSVRSTYLPLIDALPALGLIAVLGVGGHRVLNGQMTLGDLIAFNTYVVLLVWPLRTIGMTVAHAQRAAAAMERINEVLSIVPEIGEPANPRALPPGQGRVEFCNVGFRYAAPAAETERNDSVLSGFNVTIEAGTSVALVGATGSGKSTVARLLCRFYDPLDGSIRIDGVDVRDLPVRTLRHAVSVVFEDTFLFHDSVAANIAFAEPDASMERIEAAAMLAGAHEFIRELPDGYDTVLGERGYSLSGGQRQRVAIARAILSDPRVLVLDDATSAVDPTKEHEIRAALATVLHGRTTIVIAHRPATIALAASVVLLDEGRVAARGTHDELLATNARYRQVLASWDAADAVGH